MSAMFWSAALVVGIVQSLFFGVMLLLQRHTNRRAARWLALLVCALALGMLGGLFARMLPPAAALLVVFVNVNTELLFGPLLFMFVVSILDPERQWRTGDVVHFLPFLICVASWSVSSLYVSDHARLLYEGVDSLNVAGYFLGFKACVLFAYIIASCLLLSREVPATGRRKPVPRTLDAAWLRQWIIRLSTIPATIYLLAILEQQDLASMIEADEVAGLLVTVVVFLIASMILIRPSLLTAKRTANRNNVPNTSGLRAYLDEQRPWLDPELGLGCLAEAIGMTQNQLSALINDGLGTTFYGLLNHYRLTEFRRLASDPELRRHSVLELAFAAGFNSKASFYRAFRDTYGTTPTAFRTERLAAHP